MIRLRLVLYGIAYVGNIVKTLDEAYVWRRGRWVRISRKTLRRILARYRIVDSWRVRKGVVEFLLVEKTQGAKGEAPQPSGLDF